MTGRCPYTGHECDGGTVHADGAVGCGYKAAPGSECAWDADLPNGTSPRDYYNAMCMEAAGASRAPGPEGGTTWRNPT